MKKFIFILLFIVLLAAGYESMQLWKNRAPLLSDFLSKELEMDVSIADADISLRLFSFRWA